jgi:hypothetical protein
VILKSKAKEAGIEDVSPHDLRRTFVKSLFEPGNDIMFVAALGGLGIAVPAGAIPYPGAVAVIFFALSLHRGDHHARRRSKRSSRPRENSPSSPGQERQQFH